MSLDHIAEIRPKILLCLSGKYLAVSKGGAPLSIGVEGRSAAEAEELFYEALDVWEELLQRPAPAIPTHGDPAE